LTIQKEIYAQFNDDEIIYSFTLKNKRGVEVKILNFGGIISAIKTPDKSGHIENITLGHNSLQHYIDDNSYLGAIIGRYGNRIANGKFILEGVLYTLAKNNPPNHLHGGHMGFDKRIWKATSKTNKDSVTLTLNYVSKDMEEGFPGNLYTTISYSLTSENSLEIVYKAKTDKKTIINLTNHAYFNLSGSFSNDILDHQLQINATKMLPIDEFLIPTGDMDLVENTPFDFRTFKPIGKDIDVDNKQLNLGLGYDHCWCLNNPNKGVRKIASAYHKKSGRLLEVFSDQPGVQFYSGNHLSGDYQKRTGFCLETQHYPNSPNQKKFQSVVLGPGEIYSSKTSYKFLIQ
jgi:aldose 1-epimerase